MADKDTLMIEMEPVGGDRNSEPLQSERQAASGVTNEQRQLAAEFDQYFGETAVVTAKQALESSSDLVNQFIQRSADRGEGETREDRTREQLRPVSEAWLSYEAMRIRQQAATSVFETPEEAGLAAAYYNGRRETYNSARETFIANNPLLAESVPAAIGINDVQVRTREQAYEPPSVEIA